MELQDIVISLLGIVFSLLLGIIGFFTKRLLSDVDELVKGTGEIKLEMAKKYATKQEVQAQLKDGFNRLEDVIKEMREDIKYLIKEKNSTH